MESPCNQSQVDSDDDSNAAFSAVLTSMRLDRVPTFCASIRKQTVESMLNVQIDPVTVGEPIFGSYHVLFPIAFQDGVRWLLKVPACGTPTHFDSSASSALRSEALTMRLIHRETSIPVPTVLAFSASLDNELNCPFILMNFIDGISLYDCWFDRTVSKEQLQIRRTRALKDVAQAMAELGRFSFDHGGSPRFDRDGNLNGVGPTRWIDHKGMLDQMVSSDDDDDITALYFDAGPFSDPKEFYLLSIDRQGEPEQPLHKGLRKLLRMFLNWIPEHEGGYCHKFVLTHPDLDIQNVIVSEDGHLQGLIDWDGVAAVPRSVGNESYPSWLTRDWDPAMYGWNEDMERDIEPASGLWEDSPETLVRHRKEYEKFMRSQLSPQQDFETLLSTTERSRTSSSSLTAQSLFVENLLIAAENPACTFEILQKLVDTILELEVVRKDDPSSRLSAITITEANKEDDNNNNNNNTATTTTRRRTTSFETFDIFDISESLVGAGELDQRQIEQVLRAGFEALLLNDSSSLT